MAETRAVRVLLMEDDAGLARLFQKRLQRERYEVDVAADGEQGLAMYAAGPYDVVIVDQKMPARTGLEVIGALSSQGPLPPTIMVTGAGSEQIAVDAMKLGAQDYIIKDVDGGYLDLLPTVIARVLRQRRLAEEKRRAEEMAREAEKLQRTRDLAAGVAHNFNNLLTGMLGYASFVREALAEQDASLDDVDKLIGCVERVAQLTRQLRMFTERTGGSREILTLAALIEALGGDCERFLPEQVKLAVDIVRPDERLELAAETVSAALLNMCTNAHEAMPDGGTLTITADTVRRGSVGAEAEFARIAIVDTGTGITAEDLPKIFDPFFSTKNTVGVGLSLAVAQRVIEDHGGAVEVESEPGQGATFRVFLPVAPAGGSGESDGPAS